MVVVEREKPFFIVGVPRSGTTLLAVLLNNHSEIYVGKTTPAHALLELHRRIMESYSLDSDVRCRTPAERLWQAVQTQELVREMCRNVSDKAEEGLRSLLAHACDDIVRHHGKMIWGDKSPFMLNYIPQLTHLFPGVRFVHVIRDGRAVAQSRHHRRGYPLRLAIDDWKCMILHGRIDGEIVGSNRYLEVKFEELLSKPQEVLTRVCNFLGVEFEEQMLDLGAAEATERPGAYVGKRFDTSKINAWQGKLTSKQIETLESIAGDLLQALDYPLQSYPAEGPFKSLSPLAVIWYHQQLSLKDLLQPRRTAMINQQMVEVATPLPGRLRRFLSESAAQYFSERVIEHFRRRRIMPE